MSPHWIALLVALAGVLATLLTGEPNFLIVFVLGLFAAFVLVIISSARTSPTAHLTMQYQTRREPGDELGHTLAVWSGALSSWGYHVASQSATGVIFSRKARSWYIWLFALLLFPFGLLLLLITRTDTLAWAFYPKGGGTGVTVTGEAPRAIRQALERRISQTGGETAEASRGT